MLRVCETGALARPCCPVAGLTQCAHRRSQVSNRASPTIRYSQPTGQGGVGPLPLPGAKVFSALRRGFDPEAAESVAIPTQNGGIIHLRTDPTIRVRSGPNKPAKEFL